MANQRRAHKTLHCTFFNGVAGMYWQEAGAGQKGGGGHLIHMSQDSTRAEMVNELWATCTKNYAQKLQ